MRTIAEEAGLSVGLAENPIEVDEVCAFRYRIFNQELGEGLAEAHATQRDRDPFDDYAEHLVVKSGDELVGTYRLISRTAADEFGGFYSAAEFDLSSLLALEGNLLELGRSCVHPEFRQSGKVLALLWKGIHARMHAHQARFLFGCGSIHSIDQRTMETVSAYLLHRYGTDSSVRVTPTPDYSFPDWTDLTELPERREATKHIPVLIKGYLRIGARIAGPPALDEAFGVSDFLVLFDLEALDQQRRTFYSFSESAS